MPPYRVVDVWTKSKPWAVLGHKLSDQRKSRLCGDSQLLSNGLSSCQTLIGPNIPVKISAFQIFLIACPVS